MLSARATPVKLHAPGHGGSFRDVAPTPAEVRLYRFADAVTRRDVDGMIAECDPEVEFASVLSALENEAFRGPEGLRRYVRDVAGAWDEWRVELERVEEAPDGRVAAAMTMHLRGNASGVAFAKRIGHLWELRDGKLWRVTAYADDPDGPFRTTGLPLGD